VATTKPASLASLDYQQLAGLLDAAASEQHQLANTVGDPVLQYQSGVNAQVFSAARRCAEDHARSLQSTAPGR
jgi:hypothetical protein